MLGGILLGAGGAVAGVLWLRWRLWRALESELSRVIVTKDKLKELAGDSWYRLVEPAAVAGMTTYDVVHHLAMMDDRVLEAMDFSSKLDLDTFNRLDAYVHDHFFSGGAASIAGNIERLQGYTAEQIAAAHLAAQGHVVEFPDTPNQEGWDLLVDGHPMQVKCVMDPSLIQEHLERYHNIPVLVNAEMGHHFADNGHVIVDKDLIHSQVADHVHNTVHAVHGIHAMPFHVPVITLALSTVREGIRLLEGRINIFEACGNVFTDVAFVGGGGWLGGKVGLALGGAVLGPVGAAIGGVLGAVAGAILGRKAANSVRAASLEEAKMHVNKAVYEAVQLVPEAIEDRIAALEGRIASVKRRLKIHFLSWLWPSRRYLLFREIKSRVEDKIGKLREKAAWVAEAEKAYYDYSQWQNGLYKPGFEVCKWAIEEGRFNHPRLLEALNKVNACSQRVAEEAWKLGLIASPPGQGASRLQERYAVKGAK